MLKHSLLKKAGVIGLMPLAAAGVAGGVMFAQASNGGPSPVAGTVFEQVAPNPQPMDDYIKRLARNLGIGEQQLRDALKKTSKEEVDAAETSGKMMKEMADKLRAAIDSSNGFFGISVPGMHGPGQRGPGGPGDMGRGPGPVATPDEIAKFLGITPQTLNDEMKDGTKSLADEAQAHGKSRDDLKKFLSDTSNALIDQLQKDGKLTADQETTAKKGFADNVDKFIDAKGGSRQAPGGPGLPGRPGGRQGPRGHGGPGGPGGRGGQAPGNPGSPSAQPVN